MVIKTIISTDFEYEQMIDLRLNVLLKPIGIPESYIDKEKEKEDILIAAFDDDKMIGCCILSKVNNDVLQLRQMAVLQTKQGKGIGSAIVSFSEKIAKEKNYKVLMMHARDNVLFFYKKCGYEIDGEQFNEVNIPHHRMKKYL